MIKRLIGFLVTVAVLAVVVLTVLHRDRFRTMLRIGEPSEQPVVPRDTLPASAPTEQTLPDAADGQAPGFAGDRTPVAAPVPGDSLSVAASETPDTLS
ncbi:hypothetical protein [Alistipes sp. An66]|uniref:hypothetical protein n=1 Tax=Alistipes sp. An66 TaxID=1965650 RepID=UPI000B38BB7B|nr:hypothetical protein [Alistipes sp. An66]OUN60773.1 hypothetical protein B5G16_01525 [Alistipes sp. An66]